MLKICRAFPCEGNDEIEPKGQPVTVSVPAHSVLSLSQHSEVTADILDHSGVDHQQSICHLAIHQSFKTEKLVNDQVSDVLT